MAVGLPGPPWLSRVYRSAGEGLVLLVDRPHRLIDVIADERARFMMQSPLAVHR
ncbi:hypothetical protein MMEU_0643 [Mycobacterium marinum str. Europe]|nr:hypothetical protein MMEU_0643 [Mycobacterium marinum str. Europe]